MSTPHSPRTPEVKITTAALLLASFSACRTHSSATKARSSSSSLGSSSSISPAQSNLEMRVAKRAEIAELQHSPLPKRRGRSSLVQHDYLNASAIDLTGEAVLKSPQSLIDLTEERDLRYPLQFEDSEARISLGQEEIGDVIIVGGTPQKMIESPLPASSPRALRPRKSPNDLSIPRSRMSTHGNERAKSLSKKNIRKLLTQSPSEDQADVFLTGRQQIREEIESGTKVRRDNFLLTNKDYFLPLLPPNNYVRKLQDAHDHTQDVSTSPYRLLEAQPKGINATMKPYQLGGLSFLVHMHQNGMSAMLGDEMGLGKTLQTLSLFQYLEENARVSQSPRELRPYLVVCPLSVLSSWVAEARKFAPGLKVLRYHGPMTERQRLKRVATGQEDWYGNQLDVKKLARGQRRQFATTGSDAQDVPFHIMVTTYETFQSEQGWFKTAFVWKYVVLDEGHKVKNNTSQVATALQGIKAEYRLILTGTPLQNNLYEMWSLLHWLYPDVFAVNTADLFRDSFDLSHGKVTTSVLDHARRLLELVMLRRMKDSPGVDLGLPPRTEVLLYVPLTPMQRFWYTRLLTKAGNGLLDELFRDLKSKENDTLVREIESEDATIAQLEALNRDCEAKSNDWSDTKEIIMKSLENEQKDIKYQSAWQRLHNLVLQLRKCCSHPYLLPNAAPNPYLLGDHMIRASGKFIVLEKLLQEIVLKQNEKVLIFSEFTRVLDCTEDLLHLIGGNGTNFRYMRLDGSTSRARRNLNIRLFNDMASAYKVMLISTKAGGLGINLTSATKVIFMDETWNPQLTLQAEARAHRIGQTKPVTIYKLSTVGTVEEQMMGRIRKKLYLSAKITESMRSIHGMPGKATKRAVKSADENMPQLDTSQLKTLIRRGAQTLSHPEIDATEMLSWDFNTILEKCKDQSSDALTAEGESKMDEEKWLSAMEKVETAVFNGKRYHNGIANERVQGVLPDSVSREDRRKDKNTTVMVDGFAISKESMRCGEWEAVPTLAGKDPRLAEPVREKKAEVVNQEFCQVCWDGGEVILCHSCPRAYHKDCLPKPFQATAGSWRQFFCPQHECFDCAKKTTDAGGIIFRCRWCERGYCEDCLDWTQTDLVGENLIEYETLGFPAIDQAFYISCPGCNELHKDEKARAYRDEQLAQFEADHAMHFETAANEKSARVSAAPSIDMSLTTASTLVTNSDASTPVTPIEIDELGEDFYSPRKRRAISKLPREANKRVKMLRVVA